MTRVFGLAILMAGVSVFVFAAPPSAPEIDAAAGPAAIGLLVGGLLVLRARKRRQK